MKQHTAFNTLIAFDLHEVIVKPTYGRLFWYGLTQLPKKWLLLYSIWPLFWIRLIQTRIQTRVPEVIFNRMCRHYPNLESIRHHFIRMCNMQTFRPNMPQLIKHLKKSDFTICLFSNIGPFTLQDLRKKLPLDELIDDYFTPQEESDFTHKPRALFYQLFKNYIKDTYPHIEHIIFIDDKRSNVNAAEDAHFIAIRFTTVDRLEKNIRKFITFN